MFKKILANLKAILIGVGSLIAFVLWYGWRQRSAGKQLGKAEAEIEDAMEEYDEALDRVEQQVEDQDVDGLREDILKWRN